MKKSAMFLGILVTSFVIGCNDESDVYNVKPEVIGQSQFCDVQGQVRCGSECIDPKTSPMYCGADLNCKKFSTCDASTQKCSNAKCIAINDTPSQKDPEVEQPVNCNTGEHEYNKTCEPDSVEHCGSHDKSCPQAVNGWADGKCEAAQCKVEICQIGMHPNENSCEMDTIEHCGSIENSCADTIEGWKQGECSGGKCIVTECVDGYRVTNNKCELDKSVCEIKGQVRCAGECIDPLTNQAYCGADETCDNYIPCIDNQACQNGKCEFNVSADTPSFATNDGIPNGITIRLFNKSGKDICFSGKLKPYIKKGGPNDAWKSDGTTAATTQELECHLVPPTNVADGWPHWSVNSLTLAADAYKEYNFTEFTEYWGNGSFVQTVKVPMDTYANGEWYFVAEDNPAFVGSGGKGGVAAIKLGFAAKKEDGTRGDNGFLLHVRPVKPGDSKLEKGKTYNFVIYEAVTDSKYWYCD